METIINKKTEYIYDSEQLHLEMKEFLLDVKKLIKNNDYHLSEDSQKALYEYDGIIWESYFADKSKNIRKKFNKYLRKFKLKNNIYSANLLFHFIHTRILSKFYPFEWIRFESPNWIDKIKINKSLKEQVIQQKRKTWVTARDKALETLKAYKHEKGDFYKS